MKTLSVREAAQILGVSVMLCRWHKSGKLRADELVGFNRAKRYDPKRIAKIKEGHGRPKPKGR